jgi:hypothetical protein
MKPRYLPALAIGIPAFSILLSAYTSARYPSHEGAFYVAAATGIFMLTLLLFRMTQIELKDSEIAQQDWTIPFAYAAGFVLLILFYVIEWYFLGDYGPPTSGDKATLLREIATRPGLQDAIYFSIVTSTTLGYGDLAPLTYGAKMLAATQALACSIYTVTGLAILLTKRRDAVQTK